MRALLLRVFSVFSFVSVVLTATSALAVGEERELTASEKEYYHAMLLYDSYVGRRSEQIANFRALTIARVEGAARLLKAEPAPIPGLAEEIAASLDMLYAVDHMAKANAHFALKETQAGYAELAVACRHAGKVPDQVDEHIKQICKRQNRSSI